ncbi:MAG: N-acetyltransferase [Pseudomonadota bacterium]
MSDIVLRPELQNDADAITKLTSAAFSGHPYSNGTEPKIIEALRASGDLTLSIVAADQESLIGQITFSPITINGVHDGWFGLGPVSVLPDRQGEGIGSKLVRCGLEDLKARLAKGCVLVGDPAYYQRFGFQGDCGLTYGDVPAAYIQALVLTPPVRTGAVRYSDAFESAA